MRDDVHIRSDGHFKILYNRQDGCVDTSFKIFMKQ